MKRCIVTKVLEMCRTASPEFDSINQVLDMPLCLSRKVLVVAPTFRISNLPLVPLLH